VQEEIGERGIQAFFFKVMYGILSSPVCNFGLNNLSQGFSPKVIWLGPIWFHGRDYFLVPFSLFEPHRRDYIDF